MVKTFEEYVKEAKKQTDPSRNRDIDAIDSSSNAAINLANDTYNKSVEDTTAAYEDEYQKNAVQKLINEKQIAERNANLGLTDSGLNRTQQTAVQLGYANQKGNIDIAKRNALDNLSSNLAAYVTEINNERESNKLSVNQYYDQQNNTIATTMYNSDVNASAEPKKAEIENNKPQKIYWFRGKSAENDNYLYYNTESGKTEEVPPFMNPYTSSDNRLIYIDEYKSGDIGFFQLADGTPGYQPRGLVSEGGRFEPAEIAGKLMQYDLYGNGKYNTIWLSPSRHYWIWDDLSNSYKKMDSYVSEYKKQMKQGAGNE